MTPEGQPPQPQEKKHLSRSLIGAAVLWGITIGANVGLSRTGVAQDIVSATFQILPKDMTANLPTPETVNDVLEARIPLVVFYAAATYTGIRFRLLAPHTWSEAFRRGKQMFYKTRRD